MEKPPSSDESDVEETKIDIYQGIEIRIKHDSGSDKRAFYYCRSSAHSHRSSRNCSKATAGIQYEHQNMSQEMLTRSMMSQKMERFIKNIVPIIEEEVRQNAVLENLW
ncbi:hypothetical protein M3Y97_00050000 [Aphelenchoides bicaudatus]|nr:hypothetical protein M3Y97_00050000 [Aphelenchoides bicaudatus]